MPSEPAQAIFNCPTCKSKGFEPSVLGDDRCTFCDGTFSGNPPTKDEIERAAPTIPAEASTMQFILSYVNLPHRTVDLDKPFETYEELHAFVLANCKQYTSYQVIVTAPKRK